MSRYQIQKGTFIKSDFNKEEIEFEKRYGKDAKYIFNGKVIRRKQNYQNTTNLIKNESDRTY